MPGHVVSNLKPPPPPPPVELDTLACKLAATFLIANNIQDQLATTNQHLVPNQPARYCPPVQATVHQPWHCSQLLASDSSPSNNDNIQPTNQHWGRMPASGGGDSAWHQGATLASGDSFRPRLLDREKLLSQHKSRLVDFVSRYLQGKAGRRRDQSTQVVSRPLPTAASCASVCSIASVLMKHCLGLEHYEGGRLVGECVAA